MVLQKILLKTIGLKVNPIEVMGDLVLWDRSFCYFRGKQRIIYSISNMVECGIMPNFEEKIMCKKLRELDDLTPEEILLISGEKSYPVNMQTILKRLGIRNGPMDFSNVEAQIPAVIESRGSILGAVTIINDDVNIFYSEDSTDNRKRFTLAHELAHCCLNASSLRKGHIEFRFDERTSDPKELAANIFAGQLLIPEKPLRQMYDSLVIPAVDVMAHEFEVSIHVMKARLEHLGLGFYTPQNYSDSTGEG